MTPCVSCHREFVVTAEERAFLDRLAPTIGDARFPFPNPTHCAECRQQRRIAQFNQLNLYKRTSDWSGNEIISNFHPDAPYKVYEQEFWYSDAWDPLDYGRDFDFDRPFFEQFHELSLAVPRPSLFTGYQYDENCAYTNHAGKNKDCYLIFDYDENRDCYYDYSLNGSQHCIDCFRVRKSELSYRCVDTLRAYASSFLQDCDNCSDSMFLKNCMGCRNCLMCCNLRSKEYHVENRPVSKEDFERFRAALTSHSALEAAKQRFDALKLEYPQQYLHGINNENVVGDYLTNCKSAYHCFDSSDLWDCRYVFQAFNPLKDCMDIQECGDGERLYECCVLGYDVQSSAFSHHTLGNASDMFYSMYCPHSSHVFGCIGLRHKKHCIFNKQYDQAAYEELAGRIIEHMRKTPSTGSGQACEWGEFFPIEHAQVAYNETLAQEYFPLTKEEALSRGYAWRDADPKQYRPATASIPDDIAEASDAVVDALLACERCRKNYKIIPQELALHRRWRLPLPRACFDCRLREMRDMRNPRRLWQRTCGECGGEVQTTYGPERAERILCESCYRKVMY